jgi:hypothetical protein
MFCGAGARGGGDVEAGVLKLGIVLSVPPEGTAPSAGASGGGGEKGDGGGVGDAGSTLSAASGEAMP